MSTIHLSLIMKPDCHLCEDARAVIDAVCADYSGPATIDIREFSITEDPALHDRYWEEIPVLLINDKMHTYWRVDAARLRAALDAAA